MNFPGLKVKVTHEDDVSRICNKTRWTSFFYCIAVIHFIVALGYMIAMLVGDRELIPGRRISFATYLALGFASLFWGWLTEVLCNIRWLLAVNIREMRQQSESEEV